MNKFKVGDKVTLKEDMRSVYLKHNQEYVVDKVFDDNLFVQGVDFKYNSKIFELVKESNMNKFKVGDKVKLKSGTCCVDLNHIDEYTVEKSCRNAVKVIGKELTYAVDVFRLYEEANESESGILSPLEAAEALMNKDKLQVFDSDANKWYGFHNELRNITLEDLKHIKLRHKPKTVVINGVEVVAPVELPRYTVGYTPSLCHREVQTASAGKGRIMWATEDDAQKALDAMLIPFNQ